MRVLLDILLAIDSGDLATLVLLDLSAAFDIVNDTNLLQHLETFGIGGTALQWFESYLVGRQQHVQLHLHLRPSSSVVYHRALSLALFFFAIRRPSTVVDQRLWSSSSSLC